MIIKLRVLNIEDDKDDSFLLERELRRSGFEVELFRVDTLEALASSLLEHWDLIVADYNVPGMSAAASLQMVQDKGIDLPFLIVSSFVSEDVAVEAMRIGAHDFIVKGKWARLGPAIKREMEEVNVRRQHKQAELSLQKLAYHDALTQLPNRTLLQDRLEQSLSVAQRLQDNVYVIFIDLDDFKNINDSLGHNAGDQLLCEMAARLRLGVRDSDTVCRWGGDEFVLLLPAPIDEAGCIVVAEKVLALLNEHLVIAGQTLSVSASLGISSYPVDGESADELLAYADSAMYEAKSLGKNRYSHYLPEMTSLATRQMKLSTELREALTQEQFLLHYQPKVSFDDKSLQGFEALIRWQHPEKGLIYPGAFMPTIESIPVLMFNIGSWVMAEACRQIGLWKDAGLAVVPVAVNISAQQFQAKDFFETVCTLLNDTGVEPYLLEIELTETMLMGHIDTAIRTMEKLKKLGVKLSIDDFGTGYSSFSYMRVFPVDSVKLDISFTAALEKDERTRAVTKAIIVMAHSLGMKIVAEGVETVWQYQWLLEHDVEICQGYYISKALSISKATAFYHHHESAL